LSFLEKDFKILFFKRSDPFLENHKLCHRTRNMSNMNQSRVHDMEEKLQTEFALWRSGSSVYAGGSPQPREQAVLHFNNRRRALATIGMPGGLQFLVDPLSASSEYIREVYKVQILSPRDRVPVEINPNAEADERLELLLDNLFAAQEETPRTNINAGPHQCSSSMKLKRTISRAAGSMQDLTLGERLRDPLHKCMKELRNAQDLAQVLEALAMFCSHYLQLSDQPGDQEEDHAYYDMVKFSRIQSIFVCENDFVCGRTARSLFSHSTKNVWNVSWIMSIFLGIRDIG
jgi:hypothetical protein